MARPARKRKNPRWASTSFYLPRRLNFAFDRALLDLNAQGIVIDRSDALCGLIERWLANPVAVFPTLKEDEL